MCASLSIFRSTIGFANLRPLQASPAALIEHSKARDEERLRDESQPQVAENALKAQPVLANRSHPATTNKPTSGQRTPSLIRLGRLCAADEVAQAEQRLRAYIASKYQPKRKAQDVEAIPIADVLLIYLDSELARLRDRFKVDEPGEDAIPDIRKFKMRIGRLNDWWGAKVLAEVDGEQCRLYARHRGNKGGARRDLEDLRAAINYHLAEGYHRGLVKVTLPEKGRPRDAWFTREEAARLIHVCRRYREVQTASRGELKG